MSFSLDPEKQKIRDLIDNWCDASEGGDLIALTNLMTEDVTFFTPGRPPMRRKEFEDNFAQATEALTIVCHPDIQEITITGDMAVCWNVLRVDITPKAGGATVKRAGNILSALRRGTDGHWRIWRDANLLALI